MAKEMGQWINRHSYRPHPFTLGWSVYYGSPTVGRKSRLMPDSLQTVSSKAAVFLSFASQDAGAAGRMCGALRAAGVVVWFEEGGRRGGEAWDARIRRQIKECALFVPIISANAEAQPDGDFRLEWKFAEERLQLTANGRPFIMPVSVDDTIALDANMPDSFRAVEAVSLAGGVASPAFISRVQGMLGIEGEPTDWLRHIVGDSAASAAPSPSEVVSVLESALEAADPERRGARIGRYKLLQKMGEGGFGVVWMAEQQEPVRRRVALKIIKLGMDTREVITRFDVERQALALMEHPNIAHVFDAAATDAGRPYFVMELVQGVPITRYCDENRVPVEERMRLFITVCQAVHHAHQKGIVHRDLKPSNILVGLRDGAPVPKIIDFGIAKATGAQLTEKTFYTRYQTFLGTPIYASPEQMQMSGIDVDPRSDIYSLGVLLYELLTGLLPFDSSVLVKSGLEAMCRTIREVDPPAPSHRLRMLTKNDRTLAALQRGTDAAKLVLLLRGDLDWIVIRCLEKDCTRRYESAAALAADVERHLRNDAVLARPPSRIYQAQKFYRRHRPAVAAAVAALVLSSALYIRDRRAQEHAAADKMSIATLPIANLSDAKTIAVLPFANLSPDAGNAFLADGIHEDVIVSLAKIHDLKVISRTSVMAYKVGARNLRAIASELGVANILEGSVRRDGNKVRVTAQLVDARLDHPIWAETYDRNITDEFAIQSDLAREIAVALRAKLNVGERQLIDRRPTGNLEAYDLYMRARTLNQNLAFYGTRMEFEAVIALYQQAVAKDPAFALAYAELSLVHSSLYRFSQLDPSPARLASAQAAADTAVRLAPDLPETKFALGVIRYVGSEDWEGALGDFRDAEADLPNDDQLQWWIGVTLRRLGRWDEAIGYFESSSLLNPHAPGSGLTRIQTLRYLRRFSNARDIAERLLARFPGNRDVLEVFARLQFEMDADREAYLRRMDALPPDPDDPLRLVDKYDSAVRRRDWNAADLVLSDTRLRGIPELPHFVDTPVPLNRAMVAFFDHKTERLAFLGGQAIAYYQGGPWNRRQKSWVLAGRARAEAFCGRASEAVEDARAAWISASQDDALDALAMQPLLAQVFLTLGRREEAFAVLREMVAGPSDMGPQELRWDPWWASLKDDPQFEQILNSARPL